jgi:ribonuclease T2
VNPRFTLAIVAVILIGGAIALWWNDRAQISGPPPVLSASSAEQPSQPDEPAEPDASPQSQGYDGAYVLAISWHPAFCESKPNLAECRNERSSDYSADHFSLHGLWPQDDEYCGVGQQLIDIDQANRWDDLPEIVVRNATWRALARVMPGTKDSLERHEWVMHGSCAGTDADRFFARAITLVEEINSSSVRDLFARSIGQLVSSNQIRSAFDSAFGEGAGRRVRVDCENDDGRELFAEMRINLEGAAMAETDFHELVGGARNASVGCTGGIVDRVGEQ